MHVNAVRAKRLAVLIDGGGDRGNVVIMPQPSMSVMVIITLMQGKMSIWYETGKRIVAKCKCFWDSSKKWK
jgi:hypothetical protein